MPSSESSVCPNLNANRRIDRVCLLACVIAVAVLFLWAQGWHSAHAQAALLFGVTGVCLGSFANVVIWRLPVMVALANDSLENVEFDRPPAISLSRPPSRCPSCRTLIAARHNIPVLSFCLLRGRCAYCKTPISWRYPIVEAMTGASFAALAWWFGPTFDAFALAVMVWMLIVLFWIDWDTQYLPDVLTQPLLWLGLMANAYGLFVPLEQALFGAVAGYMVFWTIAALYRRLSGHDGMGAGDFKLCAALCAWLGLAALPWLMAVGAVSSVITTVVLVRTGRSSWRDPQAFGPHLIGAACFYMAVAFMVLQRVE